MNDMTSVITKQIEQNPVLLYMKGTADFPQCGFSYHVVELLKQHRVDFHAINVLEDPEIRQGIKEYSDWPTIPQLYVRGEFIGGCDIVQSLEESGELEKLLHPKAKV